MCLHILNQVTVRQNNKCDLQKELRYGGSIDGKLNDLLLLVLMSQE